MYHCGQRDLDTTFILLPNNVFSVQKVYNVTHNQEKSVIAWKG